MLSLTLQKHSFDIDKKYITYCIFYYNITKTTICTLCKILLIEIFFSAQNNSKQFYHHQQAKV